jgi:Transglutaminase-like superfamily
VLRKWFALPPAERRAAAEALVLVAFFAVTLKLFPFRVVVRWVPSKSGRKASLTAERIGALVDRAGSALRASCMPRAFALARILASRGIPHELRLGVRRSDSSITAHAWVCGESGVLIGGTGSDQYSPLFTLPVRPSP